MKRKICIVTGTRAEYGLLCWLMRGIQDAHDLQLQIIVTGIHLSPEFGLTYKEIEQDGFMINKKVEMILSADTPSAIAKSTGLGLIGFADALSDLQPDILVVLGDRYEIFAAAFSAALNRIPIAHIHGGETTQGAIDEAIRHSVTKMAYLHFVAAEEYRKRVIQLGEDPDRVFLAGGMGVDTIVKTDLLEKEELEERLDFKFGARNLMVTFHPVTLENETASKQFNELLTTLETLENTHFIFTFPNADMDGRIISKMIDDFVKKNPENSIAFFSMGRVNYLSSLQFMDAIVGNSSSGLAEAPTIKIGTINIGDRQKGRLKADSVIDCEPVMESILGAFHKLYSDKFQAALKNVENPYGKGNASERIVKVLRTYQLPEEPKKAFYDL
jgi:GDP/UDP-N,N'-diacetylbacillosamine 2-epimerase (hydrolysing)